MTAWLQKPAGPERQVQSTPVPGGLHRETAWHARLGDVLRWLYSALRLWLDRLDVGFGVFFNPGSVIVSGKKVVPVRALEHGQPWGVIFLEHLYNLD